MTREVDVNIKVIMMWIVVSAVLALSGCAEHQILEKSKAPAKPLQIENISDQISIILMGKYKIHTFYGVSNSHIIETPSQLYVIDVQFNKPLARKLYRYISTLNKPIETLILSHAHPDHWFGFPVFKNTPIVTTLDIQSDLEKTGARYIKGLKPRMGANIPDDVVPTLAKLELGKQNWDGLDIVIEQYADQEAPHSIVVKIPEYGVMIAQDLCYHDTHLVASDRRSNRNWVTILKSFDKVEAETYNTVLVGHGRNTGAKVFQEDIAYLETLENILASGATKEETKQRLIEMYPKKKGRNFINITVRNLYK